jgi:hypothetical protein
MAAAIRFTVVWLIVAGKLRQIGKESKGGVDRWPLTVGRWPLTDR